MSKFTESLWSCSCSRQWSQLQWSCRFEQMWVFYLVMQFREMTKVGHKFNRECKERKGEMIYNCEERKRKTIYNRECIDLLGPKFL